jgi:hypothetical protein
MENFKYDTLNPALSQIRLLHLSPRRSPENVDERIRCRMETVSLRHSPEFRALSYTWGNPTRTSLLIINDKIGHITQSIETALLHLRDENNTITLWIDQLCINQDDNVEKSEQVQLMKDIYQGATLVIAWLGPAGDGSDYLLDFLSDAGKEACASKFLEEDLLFKERDLEYKDSYNRLAKKLGRKPTFPMESLCSFVNRPYWYRVWVVQELSLARDVVFACGERQISYVHLRHALFFFTFYIHNAMKDCPPGPDDNDILKFYTNPGTRKPDGTLLPPPKYSMDPEEEIFYRAIMSAPVSSPAIKMVNSRNKYVGRIDQNKGLELLFILKYCNVADSGETRLEVTDPRDRIYGFLGLTKEGDAFGLRPNYSDPVAKVYTNAARVLLTSGKVDLLWLSQFPKSVGDLPTWAPDWSVPIQSPYAYFSPRSSPFSASGNKSAFVICTDDSNGVITLRGTTVDEVAVIGSAWVPVKITPNDPTREESRNKFLADIDQFCDEASCMGNGAYPDPRILEEARWRTPIGDKELNDEGTPRRATEQSCDARQDVLRRIEMWRGIFSPSAPPLSNSLGGRQPYKKRESSYYYFMNSMSKRRPFRSRKGYVGLGPAQMLPNDVVCIFLGSQVPYILRPYGSQGYQFVG